MPLSNVSIFFSFFLFSFFLVVVVHLVGGSYRYSQTKMGEVGRNDHVSHEFSMRDFSCVCSLSSLFVSSF
jgi:hypothetical protein